MGPPGSGLGAELAQYNDDGLETSSLEPSAVHMSSHGGATHLTVDEAVCAPAAPLRPICLKVKFTGLTQTSQVDPAV